MTDTKPTPYAWTVTGTAQIFFGPDAQYDAENLANCCGVNTRAFPLFAEEPSTTPAQLDPQTAEHAMRQVLHIVQSYLPPDGISIDEAMNKIIAAIDPWPVAGLLSAEPVAQIRYERNKPGRENEMPSVVSCNWLADGVYEVFTASQVQTMLARGVAPGSKAVPVEPTENMRATFEAQQGTSTFFTNTTTRIGDFGERYRAMVQDAPAMPSRQPLTVEQIDGLPCGKLFLYPLIMQKRLIARAVERAHGIGGES